MSASAPWKIVQLQLGEPLPDLSAASRYAGLYVVFWRHGIPLGHRKICAAELPLPAAHVTELAAQTVVAAVAASLFEQGFAAPLPDLPEDPSAVPDLHDLLALEAPLSRLSTRSARYPTGRASVVVCTRDNAQPLQRCLQSLRALRPAPAEILVVDNAPRSDATRRLVAAMPHVRYVMEPKPGLDVARNTGIRRSHGDVIAFTDDDVTVHPGWLGGLLAAFADRNVMAVTGLVLPAELDTETQVAFESYWSFNRGYRAKTFDNHYFERVKGRGAPVWRIGAGANMAFRRETFAMVGNFDERLDVGAAGCNGDSELWYRVLVRGGHCRYEPTAVVYHHHRKEAAALQQQIHGYMRGYVTALLVQFAKHRHWGNLRRLFLQLPRYYARLILRELLGESTLRRHTLSTELAGCASGVLFYLRNRSYDASES